MTKAEEATLYERNKEHNLCYIQEKIVHASAREIALIAAFVSGLVGAAGYQSMSNTKAKSD